MAKAQHIPPEAAQIMKRMISMPPKPHDDMKIGKPKRKGEKGSGGLSKRSTKKKA